MVESVTRWGSATRTLTRWVSPFLLVLVVFAAAQTVALSQWATFPDTRHYLQATERILGRDDREAFDRAISAYCAGQAHPARARAEARPLPSDPYRDVYRSCLERWHGASGPDAGDPRYRRIFSTRIGYPLVAAPFVAALGPLPGLWTLAVITTAASSLLVAATLRSMGTSRATAVVGQVVFLLSPLAWWSMRPLTEGLFTTATLAAVWGAVLMFGGRLRRGTAVFVAALIGAALVRYSSVLPLAGSFILVALVLHRFGPAPPRRALARFGGLSAVAVAAVAVASRMLDLPGIDVTLQVKFSRAYALPEVDDPWARLAGANVRFWWYWLGNRLADPTWAALFGLSLWTLWRTHRRVFWLTAAVALSAVANLVVHPDHVAADRLGVLLWVPILYGVPILVTEAIGVRRPRPAPDGIDALSAPDLRSP